MVIDAFRLINPQLMMLGQEPRQTTSNIGHLNKPSVQVGAPALRCVCATAVLGVRGRGVMCACPGGVGGAGGGVIM